MNSKRAGGSQNERCLSTDIRPPSASRGLDVYTVHDLKAVGAAALQRRQACVADSLAVSASNTPV
jgi:hypothetical protein